MTTVSTIAAAITTQAATSQDPDTGSTNNPDRDGLDKGFEFPAATGRDDAVAQHHKPQHRDPDLAGQDDHRHPPVQVTEHRQPDQRRADQRLVRDRVGHRAEFGHHAVVAGQRAVETIGDDGDRENDESDYAAGGFVPVAGEQRQQEDRDEHQPQQREHVGEVGDPNARDHWTCLRLPRHRNRISVTGPLGLITRSTCATRIVDPARSPASAARPLCIVAGLARTDTLQFVNAASDPPANGPAIRRARTSDVP